jgi:PIN domain nuclease of toxin-antitoxin system
VWATVSPRLLSKVASDLLANQPSEIFVSAASAWEIATKVRLGRFLEAAKLESRFLQAMDKAGYQLLPISPEIALRAGRLPGAQGDPFDRMIAAQALSEEVSIISVDEKLDTFHVRRIW